MTYHTMDNQQVVVRKKWFTFPGDTNKQQLRQSIHFDNYSYGWENREPFPFRSKFCLKFQPVHPRRQIKFNYGQSWWLNGLDWILTFLNLKIIRPDNGFPSQNPIYIVKYKKKVPNTKQHLRKIIEYGLFISIIFNNIWNRKAKRQL